MRVGGTRNMRAAAAAARTWIGGHAGPAAQARRPCDPGVRPCPCGQAEPARPRRLAQGLERLLSDGAPVAAPARALAAARAFAEGNGLLPGLRVDRRA